MITVLKTLKVYSFSMHQWGRAVVVQKSFQPKIIDHQWKKTRRRNYTGPDPTSNRRKSTEPWTAKDIKRWNMSCGGGGCSSKKAFQSQWALVKFKKMQSHFHLYSFLEKRKHLGPLDNTHKNSILSCITSWTVTIYWVSIIFFIFPCCISVSKSCPTLLWPHGL